MITRIRSRLCAKVKSLSWASSSSSTSAQTLDVAWPSDNPIIIQRAESHEADHVVTSTVLGSNRTAYMHDKELESKDPYYSALSDPDYFKTANLFTMRDMIEARIYMGHKVGTLSPEMKPFLFGERLGMCIFDLEKTAERLRLALNALAHIAYRGGIILFVTNDRWHVHAVEKAAKESGEYSYCHLYKFGLFTNAENMFGHTVRFPDLVLFTSTKHSQLQQHAMVQEAAKMQILTVGVVDSNCNPNLITYPIPGNDDSMASLQFYLRVFKEAIRLRKEKRREHFRLDVT